MPPTSTPVGSGVAGTYYFFDQAVASEGRAYRGVRTGLDVLPSSGMTVEVLSGEFHQGELDTPNRTYGGGTIALSAADATLPRIDYLSVYWDGAATQLVVTNGVPDNSQPQPLTPIPTNEGTFQNIVLAIIVVYAGVTVITDDVIYDRRFLLPFRFSGDTNVMATVADITPSTVPVWDGSGNLGPGIPTSAIGDTVGPVVAVNNQVALFDGTTGKLIKAATATGRPLLTAGVQSVGAINLASEVTGDLPLANLAQASAASKLLGRGSTSGAGDWQEVTLGSGLAMAAAVLSATGGSSGIRTVRLGSSTSVASSTTGVKVTGMTLAATGTGTFMALYALRYRSDTTAQGIRYSLNYTGTATLLFNSMVPGSSAGAHNQAGAVTNLAGASARASATTTALIHSVSVDTVNVDMLLWLFALIDVTADGDLELWHAGETATGTITTMAGAGALLVQLT